MMSLAEVEAAGGFSVIYADPAWPYRDSGVRGGVDHHYPVLTMEQICALPVARLAAPDAALFLWATWPLIFDVGPVIAAWGFTYKTCAFDWVKTTKSGDPKMGLGHWTRGNSEPCLLATRGKPKRVDAGVRQTILDETFTTEALCAPLGKHSAKPPETRDRIVRLMGDVPCVELFARTRAPGWDAWGNETESTVSLEAA